MCEHQFFAKRKRGWNRFIFYVYVRFYCNLLCVKNDRFSIILSDHNDGVCRVANVEMRVRDTCKHSDA